MLTDAELKQARICPSAWIGAMLEEIATLRAALSASESRAKAAEAKAQMVLDSAAERTRARLDAEASRDDLAEALQHMQRCRECADGSWEDCDGGRAALTALEAARQALAAPDAGKEKP